MISKAIVRIESHNSKIDDFDPYKNDSVIHLQELGFL